MKTPNHNLKQYVHAERLRQSLTPQQVAARMGYRNVNKGANRLLRFEESGFIDCEIFEKLIGALSLDPAFLRELTERDRREEAEAWDLWVNTPIPMEMIVKIIPAVYIIEHLPPDATTAQAAVAYASEYARRDHKHVCLRLSRKESAWIDQSGNVSRKLTKPYEPNQPYTLIRGRGCAFRRFRPLVPTKAATVDGA